MLKKNNTAYIDLYDNFFLHILVIYSDNFFLHILVSFFLAGESSVYKERTRWGPETDRLWVRQRDPHDKKSTDALLYPVLCG